MTTTRMTCAEATVRSMVELGCETFFNIPGRGIYPLLDELGGFPELRYITGLHEFPLSAIADGYARGSNRPVFMNLYMSTGVLNAASSIFLAQRDRVPMVVTATQAESWAVGADHRAEISDIVEAMRPVTKWAWMPPTPDRVPEALRRAYAIATTEPMGPTFVAIPVDYWTAEIDYEPQLHTDVIEPTVVASGELASIVTDIERADAPVLVAGYELLRQGAGPRLVELSRRLGCALVAEPEPAMLPASIDDDIFAGSVAEAVEVIAESDLVVHLGTNTYEAFHAKIFDAGRTKRHLWVGSSGVELNKVVVAERAVIGPVTAITTAILDELDKRLIGVDHDDRRGHVAALVAAERAPLIARQHEAWDDDPMPVARACAELRAALPPETILVDHSTTAVRLVREFFPVPAGDQYISASGSCQGWGLGAAIGVQLANPGTPVLGVVGDGGFMFGLQAVWTAAQYRIPVLVVVLDNGGWSSMRSSLARNSPRTVAAGREMHFGWTSDNAMVARGLGADAIDVMDADQLRSVLAERLPLDGPLVLNVRVRREPKTSASPFVGY